MVTNDCSTEFRNVVLEVYEVLALLVRDDIIEVNILVTPFEVVNYALIGEFLLYNEQVLEELDDSLVNIEVVEFCDHRLLILEILLVLIDQCIPLVDDATDVIKDLCVGMFLQVS